MAVQFQKQWLVNEYGSAYGVEYVITGPSGEDFFKLQQELIEEVIGEDAYYASRDVWNQIHIIDGRGDKEKEIVVNVNLDHLDVADEDVVELQEAYKKRVLSLLAWTDAEIKFVDASGERLFRMFGFDIDSSDDIGFWIQADLEQAWEEVYK